MLRTAQLLLPEELSTLGFDAGRFPPTPPACYRASWQLPGPDLHRRATASLSLSVQLDRITSNCLDARTIRVRRTCRRFSPRYEWIARGGGGYPSDRSGRACWPVGVPERAAISGLAVAPMCHPRPSNCGERFSILTRRFAPIRRSALLGVTNMSSSPCLARAFLPQGDVRGDGQPDPG